MKSFALAGAVAPGLILEQDNAPPHVARICRQFLKDSGIDTSEMPPTFTWPQPNRTPLGLYVLVHSAPPGCSSECPRVLWWPGRDLGDRRSSRTLSVASLGAWPDVVWQAYEHVGATQKTLWVSFTVANGCIKLLIIMWWSCEIINE